jgi:sugar/nucleoside kinase (ribokinase family)
MRPRPARSRAPGWEQALIALAARVPTVAVKRGSAGAAAMRSAARAEASPPPVEVVDAIGAGDSFDAGLVYGALAGWPLDRALALAVVCGARSTRASGGTAAPATLEEALAWI